MDGLYFPSLGPSKALPVREFKVTGVFVSGPGWQVEPIERTVKAPHHAYAISVVDGEALKAGKLFLSAEAELIPAVAA